MKQTNRRVFMMQVALGGTALATQQAMAQALVNEKDPQAAALGYAADTTKVDAKKFPKHAAAQNATTVLCTKVRPQTQRAAAPCLLANKFTAMAGALPTPRKPKSSHFNGQDALGGQAFLPNQASNCWLFSLRPAKQDGQPGA